MTRNNRFLHDPDFDTPGASRGLSGVFKHRYLLSLLVKKGIATRYYGSALGWIWSYIRPAAQFLMYYLVVGVILKADRDIDSFPIYLFSGIVAINLFSESLRNITGAITDNKALIRKIFLPRALFPVAAIGVGLIHFLPQAVLLLIVAIVLGWTLGWIQLVSFVGGLALILVFALGLGLFFGAVNVVYRDAKNIVDIILMFATWASPVLYSSAMVKNSAPSWLYNIYMSNPMTVAVEAFHESFWLPIEPHSARPEMTYFILAGSAIALLTLLVGHLVFRKMEGSFAQHL